MSGHGDRPVVVFIGAFPATDQVVGGNVAACRALLASDFPEGWTLRLLDSTTPSVPPPPVRTRMKLAVKRAFRLVNMLADRPAALLAFSSGGLSFIEKASYCILGRCVGVPSLLWIRDGHFMAACRSRPVFRSVARLLLRAPRLVLCQGASWKRFYCEEMGLPPSRVRVIENWLSDPECLSLAATRQYALGSRAARILFLGWLEAPKGVLDLIAAAGLMSRTRGRAPYSLLLVGDGSKRHAAREEAASLGILDRVEFAGWQNGEGKLDALKKADIFVLPSHAEGLPNALVEAMAAGLPCVVTPVGAIPDIVRNEVDGVIVKVGDIEGLAAAIGSLIDDERRRAKLGHAAHSVARARFGVDRASREISEVLSSVIADPRHSSGSRA